MTEAASLLEAGAAALAAGRWDVARAAFLEAADLDATPEALNGLANARWWLGETREAVADWERAYGAFIRESDPVEAVQIAIGLSLLQNANFGNRVVSSAWAARAGRLAGEIGEPTIDAWVLLAKAATCDDARQVKTWGERALSVAIAAGDRDLELCALSTTGSAFVDEGHVDEGTAMLDEALAGALGGEAASLDSVVFTACVLMQSCVRGADFARVAHWSRALEGFTERYGCPYVFATCRAHYGAVLVATGDWKRAETELQVALGLASDALPQVRAEASSFLAELRLGQGRVDEARKLVVAFEEHPVVLPVLAASYLESGDLGLAVTTAERRLGIAGTRSLEEARLREVLGSALLAGGDSGRAAAEGRQLVDLGNRVGCDLIRARGDRLLARSLAQREPVAARRHLDAARAAFARLEMPLEVARCRLALAEVLCAERPDVAIAEARAALTTFEDLGAARDLGRVAAWFREVGETASRTEPRGFSALTSRERDVAAVVGEGLTNPEIAERLYISRRTVEHHVASILSKLGLRNRTEIATFAAKHGVTAHTTK